MKIDHETIKIWLAQVGSIFITVSNALTPVLEFVGVSAATTYTIWKVILLHKEQKKKKNELD